ncbi:MAG: S9 family peptidase [Sphingosinicella sp.]|uniref:S9 family peptidase n=1 Tax=Sphingosinicella sp. TaxID=1917971 RepID=UPI004037883B
MRHRALAVLAAIAALASTVAAAQNGDPLIPLEMLARAPAVRSPALSPDGRQVAMVEMVDGRGTITIRDLATGASRQLYRNPDRSLSNVAWSADGRWLFTLQDAAGNEGYHLFRLDPNASGGAPRDLTPFPGATVEVLTLPRAGGPWLVIGLNRRDPRVADAYRLNLADGTLVEVARNEGSITEYHADASGRVLLATAIRADGALDILARSNEADPWGRVYRAPPTERFKVVGLSPDGRTAIVRSNRDRSAERLLRMTLASGRLSTLGLPDCGRFDDDMALIDRGGGVAITNCIRERADLAGHTPAMRAAIAALRRAAGNDAALSFSSASDDLASIIVHAEASDRPDRYFLYRGGQATLLAEQRPWLEGRRFAPSEAHWIDARDGLPLLVYLTRSPRSTGAQPMVIGVHGGPWARDTGGFENETQLFADRGYAVMQVNFRGSTGLGTRHVEAGVRQFGRAMSDDIIDALDWAVAQGVADPSRVCVMGGSYGGYATLVALTRDAERFRCGIDFAGPVDLVTLMEAFPPDWGPFLPRSWHRFVGNPALPADRADMRARSPIHRIDQLRAPLLIFQGANDPRVTQAQSDAIVCALRRRNIPAVYLLAGNEGHSFGNEETALAVNRAVELFFAQHLEGRAQPSVEPRTQTALNAMENAGERVRCPGG